MCHEYTARGWDREPAEPETESDDELPEFANEAGSEDTEVLTDGGDES
ncbi:hypothetical protein I7X12_05245 [Halosimplex litoreum]|uniref:Uncharacterized protein n=1 Tax=Halosimplex litoreum TaxID=1198301 RepID=A0A7T3G0G5_9EURY|nr:hypothetical protein [Halosimplex litoreum]QPV64036.1 hypothetical protein I7X12_05245 [Halosimplex litoreum]